MIVDKTTLQDLAIFHAEEEQSVLNRLNFARTSGGRHWLQYMLSHPFDNLKQIEETQAIIRLIQKHYEAWPETISNGTIMVLEKFYDSQIDAIPRDANLVTALLYRLIHNPDFSLVKYTVGHAIEFVQGMQQMVLLLETPGIPPMLATVLERTKLMLSKNGAQDMLHEASKAKLSDAKLLNHGYFLLYHFKNQLAELIEIHGRLDAWYSMATAIKVYGLQFPVFRHNEAPGMVAHGLWHVLLQKPVAYDVVMNEDTNFIFLTGANMAGKSTFIKSVGIAVYLAHIGMAVPANAMELTLFDGILSNIQVNDNIIKGESYFYNEVQRIKNTITRINDGKKWLVLIDELFKGTNVQDAMRCSSTVINGLLKIRRSLFILSTHLYEIADDLKGHNNIAFRYFETQVKDENLHFSYQLKDGISNDRLGYLILKREGVVKMIDAL